MGEGSTQREKPMTDPSPAAPSRLSDDTLRALIETAKKATPGPWVVSTNDGGRRGRVLDAAGGFIVAEACSTPSLDGRSLAQRTSDQAAYIAAINPQVGQQMAEEILMLRSERVSAMAKMDDIQADLNRLRQMVRDATEERP